MFIYLTPNLINYVQLPTNFIQIQTHTSIATNTHTHTTNKGKGGGLCFLPLDLS